MPAKHRENENSLETAIVGRAGTQGLSCQRTISSRAIHDMAHKRWHDLLGRAMLTVQDILLCKGGAAVTVTSRT